MQNLADKWNEEGPLDEERESKYLLPPDSLLRFSSLPMYQECLQVSESDQSIPG